MKIFLSHSWQQKLFVEKIQAWAPDGIDFWIDELKIRAGDDIETRLIDAIEAAELMILIVDREATKSYWIKKEIEWALEREKKLDRPFLFPVVLHTKAWKTLFGASDPTRKYLSCPDLSAPTVDAFLHRLSSELFQWLLRERDRDRTRPAPSPLPTSTAQSVVAKLNSANTLASSLILTIRTLIHTHRARNPLSIDALAAGLRSHPDAAQIDREGALKLLQSLADNNMLRGVSFDEHSIHLARETNSDKEGLFTTAKAAIAAAAVRMINSGDRVGIDGGSTTLQIAMKIANELQAESLTDLQIFTNSVPVAHRLLKTLSEMKAQDHDTRCRVTLTGGWCRPTSLTVVPISRSGTLGETVMPPPDDLDIAFLGTNGLKGEEGFGLTHDYEVPAKRALLHAAKRRVFVTDPSKFEVQQSILFARFDEGLEILTADVEEYGPAIELVRRMLEGTPSRIEVVEAPNA